MLLSSLQDTFQGLMSHDPKNPTYLATAQRAHQRAAENPEGRFPGFNTVLTETADLYKKSLEAWNRVADLVAHGVIRPEETTYKVSPDGEDAVMPADLGREQTRVIFYATKFEPAQMVHLLVIPFLLAKYKADKVVIMNDNSDPRKPQLVTLTVREPVAHEDLRSFGPFVQFTTFHKENLKLFRKDGETIFAEFLTQNASIPMEALYVAGYDHLKLTYTDRDSGEEKPDTPLKIREHLDNLGQRLNNNTTIKLVFLKRPGITLPQPKEVVEHESGVAIDVVDLGMEVNVAATMVRQLGRYWLTLYQNYLAARALGVWGFDNEPLYREQQEATAQSLIQHLSSSPAFNKQAFLAHLAQAGAIALEKVDQALVGELLLNYKIVSASEDQNNQPVEFTEEENALLPEIFGRMNFTLDQQGFIRSRSERNNKTPYCGIT